MIINGKGDRTGSSAKSVENPLRLLLVHAKQCRGNKQLLIRDGSDGGIMTEHSDLASV